MDIIYGEILEINTVGFAPFEGESFEPNITPALGSIS
jgi:hypothetical protein